MAPVLRGEWPRRVLLQARGPGDHGIEAVGADHHRLDRRHRRVRRLPPGVPRHQGAVPAFTRSVAVEVAGASVFVNAIPGGGILTPPRAVYLASGEHHLVISPNGGMII
ncbi:MAG TPA: hypothetical protein VHS97_17465 [Isosphaeraceae bacterium]|nr:hypothetical protein [Isosphaeraceae bacterium]